MVPMARGARSADGSSADGGPVDGGAWKAALGFGNTPTAFPHTTPWWERLERAKGILVPGTVRRNFRQSVSRATSAVESPTA